MKKQNIRFVFFYFFRKQLPTTTNTEQKWVNFPCPKVGTEMHY